jgi:predicted DNA-binding transcriptional regulator AlpA
MPSESLRLLPNEACASGTPLLADGLEETSIPSAAQAVTKAQVAAMLQVAERSVERLAATGSLPGRLQLPGRAVRYNRSVVGQWIAAGCPPQQLWPSSWRPQRRLAH